MNIDRKSLNEHSLIDDEGYLIPLNLNESDDTLTELMEHRGKPDPKNVKKREDQRRRGEQRRRNAREREAEAERKRIEREKRRAEREREEANKKTSKSKPAEPKKSAERKSAERKSTERKAPEKPEKLEKTEKKPVEMVNKKVEEVKGHVSESKSSSRSILKKIKPKNDEQKQIVKYVEDSIEDVAKSIEKAVDNEEKFEFDDIIKKGYGDIVKKNKDIKIVKEDDWGDLGTFTKDEEDFMSKFDDFDDFEDEDVKGASYYEKRLKTLNSNYKKALNKYSGNKDKLVKIKKEYNKKKDLINKRIKQTGIESWQDYKNMRDDESRKRKEELRKNPVINWIRMTYFKTMYPFYKAKEKIGDGINWLYDFDHLK